MALASTQRLNRTLVLIGASLFCNITHAVPVVFSGVDAGNSNTVNSDAAFANWSASAGSFVLDNLTNATRIDGGFLGPAEVHSVFGSGLVNVFTTIDDAAGLPDFATGVLDGRNLRITKNTQASAVDDVSSFNWQIAELADSFGFFSRNNDGGLVTIDLMNGSSQSYNLTAAGPTGPGDNLFWGITDLGSAVMNVTITSTDPGTSTNGGNSHWDRFVYRSVSVPEPGMMGLMLFGLACLGFSSIKRRSYTQLQ